MAETEEPNCLQSSGPVRMFRGKPVVSSSKNHCHCLWELIQECEPCKNQGKIKEKSPCRSGVELPDQQDPCNSGVESPSRQGVTRSVVESPNQQRPRGNGVSSAKRHRSGNTNKIDKDDWKRQAKDLWKRSKGTFFLEAYTSYSFNNEDLEDKHAIVIFTSKTSKGAGCILKTEQRPSDTRETLVQNEYGKREFCHYISGVKWFDGQTRIKKAKDHGLDQLWSLGEEFGDVPRWHKA